MSAHRKPFEFLPPFRASQTLLRLFLHERFFFFLANEYHAKDLTSLSKKIWREENTYSTFHALSDLGEGLEFAHRFLRDLQTDFDEEKELFKFTGEWNYLGQAEEKTFYLERITKLFWSHQDRDSVKAHPEFTFMLEHPWALATHAAEFDFFVPAPADTFTPKTVRFVEKLLNTLPGWELAPYLVTNEHANFHWRILLNQTPLLTGTIAKDASSNTLVQETRFRA